MSMRIHIRLETVDGFIPTSDFFTIDVADAIGQRRPWLMSKRFVEKHQELVGTIEIPGIASPFKTTASKSPRWPTISRGREARRTHLSAYRSCQGVGNFVTEVSMDETDRPQTPPELLIILAALADEQYPAANDRPQFTGRFNKGVDYVGDVAQFDREFNDDLAVIAHAVQQYGLPRDLKLSVHSAATNFRSMAHQAGAQAHRRGLAHQNRRHELARGSHRTRRSRRCWPGTGQIGLHQSARKARSPLRTVRGVIDVDPAKLPSAETVAKWSSEDFVSACGTIRKIRSSR